jgi:hypothetical protein
MARATGNGSGKAGKRIDVCLSPVPAAIIVDAERQLLAVVAERRTQLPASPILN